MSVILSSCLGTKYLKKDETVLKRQKIKSDGKVNQEALFNQLAQTPNSRPIRLPIAHLFYLKKFGENFYDSARIAKKIITIDRKYKAKINKASSNQRKTKLNEKRTSKLEKKNLKLREGNQMMRWGEPLAIFDSSKIATSETNMKNYLFSHGYFNAEIDHTTKTKNEKTKITYSIDEGEVYRIDSMIYIIEDKDQSKLFHENIEKQLLIDKKYNQDLFGEERNRVYDLFSNNGYYNFKRQYVLFEVDSTVLNDHKLVVRQTIANPPDKSQHKTYRLDSIIFSTEQGTQRRYRKPIEYNDVTFNFRNSKYPERLLSWRIFLEKDSLYSKKLTLESQRQLSYLDIFKFVNINYDTTGGQFVANIFTSPLKKYQTSTEVGLSVLDQSYPGPFFNFNAKGRNIFGGMEIIQFDGNAGIQGIKPVTGDESGTTQTNYSRLQYGGQVSVTFPQFLFPLSDNARSKIGRYNPRTKIQAGLNFENRIGEYERRTINTGTSYIWQVQDNAQFTFKPFDASYIFSVTDSVFDSRLEERGNNSLIAAFKPSFVSFSSFNARFNANGYGVGNNNAHFIQAYLETGGNIQNIIGDETPFGDSLEYYKYIKSTLEYRQNFRLTSRSAFAYRVNVGAAYSYADNSADGDPKTSALPYEKYFFAGGSNSIRAWAPRRLGPGAHASYLIKEDNLDQIVIDDKSEQPGDILLELGVEYRCDLIAFIDYALFIDAGNSWLWKSDPLDTSTDGDGKDNGVFKLSEFPSEIAVGAGFGLRFDFSFLVLRFDLAYKVVDPGYPKGERFILDDYHWQDLWDLRNRKRGAINIGIGYPF
ncbi:MAG: BamA/TamA family outer membrane protein [Marinoscillum sp.]